MEIKPVIPFEPVTISALPTSSDWVAQIKWDGVRMLTYFDGKEVRLVNRKVNDRTMQYPEFLDISRYCRASSVILDGEFIAFDSSRPSFHEIMKRDSLRKEQRIPLAVKQTPVTYMIFDLLYANGDWVTEKPLKERQQLLADIIIPQPNVQVVQNVTDAEALYTVMKQHQMEGIVCKDLNSTYVINGKDRRWQKKKIFLDHYAAIGGFTRRNGMMNALLLGLFDAKGDFRYIGSAGIGKIGKDEWRKLEQDMAPLPDKPFVNQPDQSRDAVWTKPQFVVKVEFLEWTPAATMRQPVIQAIVQMPVADCRFDQHPEGIMPGSIS
ncbi:UNVERIFIED_CONTAM: bifunctional non-homologous end joining protein LigD [Brevibacillus sp. OAP136]